ncbi:MAG: ABC-F family ATP-binding cassette domain-containing protein [Clostridiales bacterium]|nr:ABC-F family ATP-binding cassette domain-containing protein [Clostridiales bacterium]
MIDISVSNIVKAFEEGDNILDGVTFSVNAGERVGLLGANGAGKTTLFRLISGELESDEGDIVTPAVKKLGLISQIPVYPDDYAVEDVLRAAQSRLFELRAEMERLERELESGAGHELLAGYDALAYEYEISGGYTADVERNRVANGLEIPAAQRSQLFSTLSGGEKTRVNLARLILEDTDILLLDEPTNHLDMRAVEWLEDYLSKFRGTVLAVSHDRYFLDRAVTRIVELVNGKAELYSGNYSFYVVEKQRRQEELQKRYEREQAEIKRLQATADRLYSWSTEKMIKQSQAVESRIAHIKKGAADRPARERAMRARFGEREFRGDEALVFKGLKKSYGGRVLFEGIEAEVRGGERIALLGDNGSGKTTLINVLLGIEKQDEGFVRRGPSVKMAYLPQIVHFENPHRSILDTVIHETRCSPQTARNRLGAFKFSGEDVFKSVGDLSGGEKSRLRLCILMDAEINFLILDEPTNHLDIASREWIEEAISDYEGVLLFVSHDRYFISRFATRIWELDGGLLTDYNCPFEEYRAAKAGGPPAPAAPAKKAGAGAPKRKKSTPKSAAKQIEKLEREITELEKKLQEVEERRFEVASDYEKLLLLDGEEDEIQTQLEEKLAAWEEAGERAETI